MKKQKKILSIVLAAMMVFSLMTPLLFVSAGTEPLVGVDYKEEAVEGAAGIYRMVFSAKAPESIKMLNVIFSYDNTLIVPVNVKASYAEMIITDGMTGGTPINIRALDTDIFSVAPPAFQITGERTAINTGIYSAEDGKVSNGTYIQTFAFYYKFLEGKSQSDFTPDTFKIEGYDTDSGFVHEFFPNADVGGIYIEETISADPFSAKHHWGSKSLTNEAFELTRTYTNSVPVVTTPPTATAEYGTALSAITLEGGTTITAGTWSWNDADAATIIPVIGSVYSATFTPTDTNYDPVEMDITLTITPKPITIVPDATTATKIYGASNSTISIDTDASTSLVGDDTFESLGVTLSTAAEATSDVGEYDITCSKTGINGNYDFTLDTSVVIFSVTPANIVIINTITTPAETDAYIAKDAADAASIAALAEFPSSVDVTLESDGTANLAVTWAITTGTHNAKGGTYTLTGTPTLNDNITNTEELTLSGTVTVIPVSPIAPEFADAYIRVDEENGATLTPADLTDKLPASGNASFNTTATIAETDKIPYTIVWAGEIDTRSATAAPFDGVVTYTPATLPAWLTVSGTGATSRTIRVVDKFPIDDMTIVTPSDIIYGGTLTVPVPVLPNEEIEAPVFTYTYSGTANDATTLTDSSDEPTQSGTYTVTATLDDPDYAGSVISEEFTINRKSITATVAAANRAYGDANPAFTFDFPAGSFVGDDTGASLATEITLSSTAIVTSNAGNYDVTAATGTGDNGNYIVTVNGTGKLAVNKRPVTITIDDKARGYGADNPELTFTVDESTPLVNSDTNAALEVTLDCAATAASPAGTLVAITGTAADDTNYAVTINNGDLTINKIAQTTPVTVTLSPSTAIKDVTTAVVTATAEGGEGTGDYEYSSSNTAVATIDKATGIITVVAEGATNITAKRLASTNYNESVSNADVTFTVLPKVELVAANTNAAGAHLVNAKNQDKVTFGEIIRVDETNNFTVSVTGTQRLELYESEISTQGEGYWVGIIIGKKFVTDAKNLFYKTDSAYYQITAEDATDAVNAGGGIDNFVYWIKVDDTDAGPVTTKTIDIADSVDGLNESRLTINFKPYTDAFPLTITSVNGSYVSVTNPSVNGKYKPGTTVTLNITTSTGYTFEKWTASPAVTFSSTTATTVTFTMPSSALTITPVLTYSGGVIPYTPGTGTGTGTTTGTTDTNNTAIMNNMIFPQVSTNNIAANVTISEANINTAINNALSTVGESQDLVVTINFNAPTNTSQTNVTITTSALAQLDKNNVDQLVINSGKSVLTIDNAALESIIAQADGTTVTFEVEKLPESTLTEDQKAAVGGRPLFEFNILSAGVRITNFGEGTITVAVPYLPAANENPNAIVIYYLDDTGNISVIENGIFDPKTNTVVFTTSHFSKFFIGYNYVSFDDVAKDYWGIDYIEKAAARGIVKGYGNGLFQPEKKITRAEFVQILANILKLSEIKANTAVYSDVAEKDWFYPAIMKARSAGILAKFNDEKFNPNDVITREEMAALIANILRAEKIITDASKAKLSDIFQDAYLINPIYTGDILDVLVTKVMTGVSSNGFAPKSGATRAQAATIQIRLLEILYR